MRRPVRISLFAAAVLLIVGVTPSVFGAVITSAQSGNWSTGTTWVGGAAPAPGDSVVIATGHTVTNDTLPAVNALTVQSGGTLDTSSQFITVQGSLTLSGTVLGSGGLSLTGASSSISGNGTSSAPLMIGSGAAYSFTGGPLTLTGTVTVDGTLSNGSGTLYVTDLAGIGTYTNMNPSTLHVLGSVTVSVFNVNNTNSVVGFDGSGAQTIPGVSYYTLNVTNSSTKTLGGNTTINGNLTVASGTLSDGGNLLVGNALGTLTLGAGATLSLQVFMPSFNTYSYDPTSIVSYDGDSGQTITSLASPYPNLYVKETGAGTFTKVLNGNVTAASLFVNQISGIVKLQTAGYDLTVNGAISGSGWIDQSGTGGTIHALGSVTGWSGTYVTNSTSTFSYEASGSQTIRAMNYNNLTVNNPSGAFSNGGTLTVLGDFSFIAGNLTVTGPNTLDVTGSLYINSNMAGTGALRITGSAGSVTGSGTVATPFDVQASKSFNTSSGFSVTSTLTLESGVTVTNTGTAALYRLDGIDATSKWINSTGAYLSHAYNDIFQTAGVLDASTTGNTVEYNNNGPNTIIATTYYNLVLSTAGTKTFAGGTTVDGDFTVTGSVTTTLPAPMNITGSFSTAATDIVNLGTGSVSVGGNFTAGGSSVSGGSSTLMFNGAALQTVSPGTSSFNNIIIGTGASIDLGSSTMLVAGNWTNTGTFAGTGSTVTFNGATGTQSIGSTHFDNLSFTGGATKTPTALLVTDGNVVINTGATVTGAGGNQFQVAGNWTNNGTFTNSGVVFDGSSNQSITPGTGSFLDLSFTGSGTTKTVNGPLTINGGLTIGSGVTLNAGTYSHSITGDITHNGSGFSNGSGSTWTLNGTTAQTVGGTTGSLFNNVTVTNASGVTLTNTMGINGTLSLGASNIDTGSSEVILAAGATLSRTSGFIIGKLQKKSATGSVTFELGTTYGYSPVQMTVTGTSDLSAAIATGTACCTFAGTNHLNEYWQISSTAPVTADLTFNWTAAAVAGTESNYILGRNTAGSWSYPSATITPATHIATTSGVSIPASLESWIVGEPSSLAGAPAIASFTPIAGSEGVTVTITGSAFSGATAVQFNGTNASYTVDSDTQITTTVPAGASTGQITVTTAGGTGTSASNFTVNAPGTITSAQSGSWETASTWTNSIPPGTLDTVEIVTGHTVTLSQGHGAAGLIVDSGATLAQGTNNLTIAGSATVNGSITGGATLILSGSGSTINGIGTIAPAVMVSSNYTIANTSAISYNGGISATTGVTITNNGTAHVDNANGITGTGTWTQGTNSSVTIGGPFTTSLNASASGNTIDYNGAGPSVNPTTGAGYYNLTLSGSGTTTLTGFPTIGGSFTLGGTVDVTLGASLSIGGTVTIPTSTKLTLGSFNHNVAGNWTNTGGQVVQTGSTITFNGTAAQTITRGTQAFNNVVFAQVGTKSFSGAGLFTNGSVTINAGATVDGGTFIHQISGDWTNNGTFTTGTSTVQFLGITTANVTGGNFATFQVNKSSGSVILLSNCTATASTSLSVGTLQVGAWTLTTFAITGTGSLTMTSGTLNISGASNGWSGTFTPGTGTVVMNGIANQSARGGTFYNLTINNSGAGVVTINSPLTVNNLLYVAAGTLFDNGNQINGGGSATLQVDNGAVLKFGTSGTATSYPSGFVAPILGPTSTIDYASGNPVQQISTIPTYGNLLLDTSGSTLTKVVSGTTLNANSITLANTGGGTLTLDLQGKTVNVGGDLTGTGNITFATSSGSLNIGGNFSITGLFTCGTSAVQFNGTGAQSVKNTTYNDLIIAGSGTATLAGATIVNGALTINTGATLAMNVSLLRPFGTVLNNGTLNGGANTLDLRGNFVNNGTFSSGTGTVAFNGTAAQTWSGTSNAIFNNVTNNNTIGLTFARSVAAIGTFTLNGSNVVINSGQLVAITSGGTINRVAGHFIGKLSIDLAAGTPTTFTIGTSTGYAPVDVTAPAASTFAITPVSGTQPNVTGPNVISRYWTIDPSTTPNVTMTFNYNVADITSGTEGVFTAGLYNGSWVRPATTMNTATHQATVNSVAAYAGDWTVGEPLSLAGTATCTTPPANLVSWWRGEGDAIDDAGVNNGTLTGGATTSAAKVSQGFQFNGTTAYVSVPDSTSLRPTTGISVEGWVNFSSFPAVANLFSKAVGNGAGPTGYDSYAVWYDGSLRAEIGNASGQGTIVSYAWTPTIGTWHHVAFTADSAGNETLYVDGASVATASAGVAIGFDTNPFTIGADYEAGAPTYFFDGFIDEVSLYDTALSASAIANIYAADVAGKCFTASAPVIASFSPSSGPTGTAVTISGSNFIGTRSVTFNGTPAVYTVTSGTQLSATVPGAATSGPIAITNAAGTYTTTPSFVVGSSADLAITHTVSPTTSGTGGTLTYTAVVANNGPLTATGVTLTDVLPPNVTFSSATGATCSNSSNTVTCTVSSIAATGSVTITITTIANSVGTATATASASATEADSNSANNTSITASASITGSSIIVTNTNDSGTGSLRQAIIEANANTCTAPCTIQFAIGSGAQTIALSSALPTASVAVIIDGTTQPGYAGSNLITIDETADTTLLPCLELDGGNSTVRALNIRNSHNVGLVLGGAGGNNTVQSCAITGNAADGMRVYNANNTIGGATGALGNLISGNGNSGVVLFGTPATANVLRKNVIGLNAAGTAALANGYDGVQILDGASGNTIDLNVISGNSNSGIYLTSSTPSPTQGNLITGNYIGTNAAGTAGVGNGVAGVYFGCTAPSNTIGGTTAVTRNVISANSFGFRNLGCGSNANVISGNYIGTAADGVTPLGNGIGVALEGGASGTIIGGTSAAASNLIANSTGAGIGIAGPAVGNAILHNSITANATAGVDLDGLPLATINDAGDADTGGNNLQNSPVLTTAQLAGTNLTVAFSVDSSSVSSTSSIVVEVFKADASGQGQTFLGTQCFNGNNVVNTLTIAAAPVAVNDPIVATATTYNTACGATTPILNDGTSPFSTSVNVTCAPASTTITAPPSVCANTTGNVASIGATSGATYTWAVTNGTITAGQGTTSITFTSGASGNVTISVNVNVGTCTSSGSTSVPIGAATATITAGGPTTFCNGGSVVLTASSGTGYQWFNGAGPLGGQTAQTFTATTSGTYTVTVTNGSCSATSAPVTVTVNPLPPTPAITGATTFCNGSSTTLSAPAGYTYLWSDSETTQSIVVTAAGTYTVTVSDANGCSATSAPVTVTVTPSPSAAITAPSTVNPNSSGLTASVAAGASTYNWSITGGTITAGQGTPSITFSVGATSATLNVTVTASGCTATGTKTVFLTNSADLAITAMTATPDPVSAGAALTYTIHVTNNGPSSASNVVVNDPLPAGTTFVSAGGTGWTCTSAVQCSTSSLASGATSTITIVVNAPSSGGPLTNTASVSSQTVDPKNTNNSLSATTLVDVPSGCPAAPPSLVAPASGASGITSPVSLQWTAVSGASYQVFAAVDNAAPEVVGTTSGTSLFVNLPSGSITWFVAATVANCSPLTSGTSQFTIPVGSNCSTHTSPSLIAPTPNTTTAGNSVTFSWQPVPEAIGYRVLVSVNGSADEEAGTTNGATTLTVDVASGSITWQVDALFNGCPSTRSAPASFTVPTIDPCANHGTATLIAPANNSSASSSTIDFQWTAVDKASGYRVWAAIDGAAPAALGETVGTTLRANIASGAVDWYVEALFDGCASTSSSHFLVNVPKAQSCGAETPVLTAPSNNSTTTTGNITFAWNAVTGATGYELYLSLDKGTAILAGTTSGATTLQKEVGAGTLDWFVRALFNGCPVRDSQTFTFLYQPADACKTNMRPVLASPADGAQTIFSPADFDWNDVHATSYRLYVNGQLRDTVAQPRRNALQLANGTYEWYVEATFDGCATLRSTTSHFVVVSRPPTCVVPPQPVILAPGEVSTGIAYKVRWLPAIGAETYIVQEANNASFIGASINGPTTANKLTFTHSEPGTFFYRVRGLSGCGADSGPYSAIIGVTILPQHSTDGAASPDAPVTLTYSIHLDAALAGQTFTATPTKRWLTVTPSSGTIPAGGLDLTVTGDTAGLPIGTSLGGVTITTTSPSSSKYASSGSSTSTTTLSVNVVQPVSPTSKSSPPPDALIIPAVAHAEGFNSQFQSDVRLTNTSPQPIKYEITFTPTGEDGLANGKQTQIDVDPGRTVALDDILKTWFSSGSTASVTGTLEIRPLTSTSTKVTSNAITGLANLVTFAASRTFNNTGNGTYGQYIPAIPFANFIGKSTGTITLQQIAQSEKYRTNVGLVEGSGQPASLLLSIFGSNGQKIKDVPLDLKGGQHTQLNSFLATQGLNVEDARIEVKVASGSGRVTAYASVLDNQTSDPLLVTPVLVSGTGSTKYVVPGVADLSGGAANWRSDMRLFNTSNAKVDVDLTFISGSGVQKTQTMSLAANEVKQLDNLLPTVFGVTNDGGAVHISTAKATNLIATARTYNQTTHGTYGQFITAVTPNDAAAVGTRPLQLLQVEESDRYRTNVGLAEVSGQPAKVLVTVIPPDSRVSANVEINLAANEFRQLNQILKQVGMDNTYNARVSVQVIEGAGRITAYASVIDMTTQDPTYVQAQ